MHRYDSDRTLRRDSPHAEVPFVDGTSRGPKQAFLSFWLTIVRLKRDRPPNSEY